MFSSRTVEPGREPEPVPGDGSNAPVFGDWLTRFPWNPLLGMEGTHRQEKQTGYRNERRENGGAEAISSSILRKIASAKLRRSLAFTTKDLGPPVTAAR